MDRLTKLEVFSKIAETGSFYATARSLNLSRPTVTRLMAELEKDLNQTLLFRNTRRVSLTSAGESFLPRARELLNMASDIFHSPRNKKKNVLPKSAKHAVQQEESVTDPLCSILPAYSDEANVSVQVPETPISKGK